MPATSSLFTADEVRQQKEKRAAWLQNTQQQLAAAHSIGERDKQRQANRALVLVLVMWLVVIALIVWFVGGSLLFAASKSRQDLGSPPRVQHATASKPQHYNRAFSGSAKIGMREL